MYFQLCIFFFSLALFFGGCSSSSKEDPLTIPIDAKTNSGKKVLSDNQDKELKTHATNNLLDYDSLIYSFVNEVELLCENCVLNKVISNQTMKGINFGFEISSAPEWEITDIADYSYVSEVDSACIVRQIEKAKNKVWDLNLLNAKNTWDAYNNWTIENHPFNWEQFKSDGFGCFTNLGIPIFNHSNDIAIIYIGNQCHYTAGSGEILKFKKVNGKWQFIDDFRLWIS